jgi:glutathione S-transferase
MVAGRRSIEGLEPPGLNDRDATYQRYCHEGCNMLTVLGRTNSSNVQKVLWCLDELGVSCEREDVGGAFGRNKEAAYLAMNPNGLIPTVLDEGCVLWESNTILRYLAARYGSGSLWEPDPGRRAEGEKWMDWQITVLAPSMTPLFKQHVRVPAGERDQAVIDRSFREAARAFTLLDGALAKAPWLGGGRFTVADIPCGVLAYRWMNLPIERPALPALADWYGRLAERGAYRNHVMVGMT